MSAGVAGVAYWSRWSLKRSSAGPGRAAGFFVVTGRFVLIAGFGRQDDEARAGEDRAEAGDQDEAAGFVAARVFFVAGLRVAAALTGARFSGLAFDFARGFGLGRADLALAVVFERFVCFTTLALLMSPLLVFASERSCSRTHRMPCTRRCQALA
jgi:hypothetical protein